MKINIFYKREYQHRAPGKTRSDIPNKAGKIVMITSAIIVNLCWLIVLAWLLHFNFELLLPGWEIQVPTFRQCFGGIAVILILREVLCDTSKR